VVRRIPLQAEQAREASEVNSRPTGTRRGEGEERNLLRLLPLRAIYRRALDLDQLAVNPTLKLRLPAVRGKRERVARADEAAARQTTTCGQDRAS